MVDLKRTMYKLLTEGNPLRPGEDYAVGLDPEDIDTFVDEPAPRTGDVATVD